MGAQTHGAMNKGPGAGARRQGRPTGSGLLPLALAITLAVFVPLAASGDERTDRLVELLAQSGNYRVRVQSAQSLGRIRDPETVPALVRALEDRHPAVRAAAAQSLGRIGSPDAVGPLESLAGDGSQPEEVRAQARAAVAQIRSMSRMGGRGPAAGPPSGGAPSAAKVRYYVGVGDMGNTTGRRDGELEQTLKRLVRDELGRAGGIDVAPDGETPRQTKRVLDSRGLTGYFVQGSVTRLEAVGGQIQAVVSLMVLTNPDRNLRMMLQGRGAAAVRGSASPGSAQLRELEDTALEAAVQGAVSRLAGQLTGQP